MRVLRAALSCAVFSVAAARSAEWKPQTDGVAQLNAVEQALNKIQSVALDDRQRKAAAAVVQDVEHALVDLRTGSKLTKAEKKARVKVSIDKLQALQSQWELASVENSLQALLKQPMSPSVLMEARSVAASVNSVVDAIESGKLKGDAQHNKAGQAVEQLQALQQHLQKASGVDAIASMEHLMADKKAQLDREEKELQLVKLEKKLLEKKAALHDLEAQQRNSHERRQQQEQDAAQQAQISKLVTFAKELVAAKAVAAAREPASSNASVHHVLALKNANQNDALPPQISAILTDLSARAQNVSAALSKMDAEEKKVRADLENRVQMARNAPVRSSKDPMARAANMLSQLEKRQRRNYLKARSLKVVELKELTDGIQKIKSGDLQGLTTLLKEMEHESKSLEAESKGFLY